jgi:hypothetical protein
MSTVEITDVQTSAEPRKHLHGRNIDCPKAGATSDIYSFEVTGWAPGKSAPVASIEVVHEGRPCSSYRSLSIDPTSLRRFRARPAASEPASGERSAASA